MINSFSMPDLRQSFPISGRLSVGDDFCVVDFKYREDLTFLLEPFRFDGYLAFFCISGEVPVEINLKQFETRENSLFITIPGTVIKVGEVSLEQKESLHFIMIALSKEYMSSLKLDIAKLFSEGMLILENPCVVLTEQEKGVALSYLQLLTKVMTSSLSYKRDCLGSLVSSVFFLAGGVIESRLRPEESLHEAGQRRSRFIFDKFLRLVAEYHRQQRSVIFYADKLCLTPKYLSKIIKEVSGRSAPQWIDSYVILSAKSMLKYTSMAIKEIVSDLNFPDQPSFFRFFKIHTGMTPKEYRDK